jgi:hypothetical protein
MSFQSNGSDAQAMALKQLTLLTHQQGVVMAFTYVFFLLTLLFVGLGVLAILMKKPTQAGDAASGHFTAQILISVVDRHFSHKLINCYAELSLMPEAGQESLDNGSGWWRD